MCTIVVWIYLNKQWENLCRVYWQKHIIGQFGLIEKRPPLPWSCNLIGAREYDTIIYVTRYMWPDIVFSAHILVQWMLLDGVLKHPLWSDRLRNVNCTLDLDLFCSTLKYEYTFLIKTFFNTSPIRSSHFRSFKINCPYAWHGISFATSARPNNHNHNSWIFFSSHLVTI